MGDSCKRKVGGIVATLHSLGIGRPGLSLIIPVYNSMPYFKECLDSVFSQDLDSGSYEVILVDDGSTDGSGALCDETAAKHKNVKVVHQDNSGYASRPRNVGLDIARGEYVFFADADDNLYPHALSKMLDHARDLKCDIGLFKIDAREWGTTHAGLFAESREHCTFSNANLVDFFGSYRLIKRNLIEDNRIRFIEGINPEDWAFALECYLCADNICVINDQYYYRWRKRSDGRSLTMGHLSFAADNWKSRFEGHRAYIDVALRYRVLAEHPQIMLRLCREIVKIATDASESKFPDEGIKAYRNLVAPYYTDAVRALMPISVLITNDAIQQGLPADELSKLLPLDDRIDFFRNVEGKCCYEVFTREGRKAFDALIPESVGLELGSPKYSFCHVTSAEFVQEGLKLTGSLFLLRSVDSTVVEVQLSLAVYGQNEASSVQARATDARIIKAYAEVYSIRMQWEAEVPYGEMTALAEVCGMAVDLDPSLLVRVGESQYSFRLGKNRSREADEGFKSGSAYLEAIEPLLTGYDNFRIRITG